MMKHPVIMPKGNHVTQLLIRQSHEEVGHMGRSTTICQLRKNGYWIVGASSAVGQHISKCVVCKKARGSVQEQKMADLAIEKLKEEPPFTYPQVDCSDHFTSRKSVQF